MYYALHGFLMPQIPECCTGILASQSGLGLLGTKSWPIGQIIETPPTTNSQSPLELLSSSIFQLFSFGDLCKVQPQFRLPNFRVTTWCGNVELKWCCSPYWSSSTSSSVRVFPDHLHLLSTSSSQGFELAGCQLAVRYPDRIPRGMGFAKAALKSEDLRDEDGGWVLDLLMLQWRQHSLSCEQQLLQVQV